MGRTETCSKCCIALSIPAIIFLVIIGTLLNTQPFYVSVEIEDPDAAATECYFAALLYLVALGLSFGSICYKKNSQRLLLASQEELLHRDEGAELLGDNESGYGSVARLSQMPLMPQGYSRSDQYS